MRFPLALHKPCTPADSRVYEQEAAKHQWWVELEVTTAFTRYPHLGRNFDRKDMLQEANCAIAAVLPNFDPSRGAIKPFLKSAVRNVFAKLARETSRLKRCPHITQVDEDGNERSVPYPAMPWQTMDTDGAALEYGFDDEPTPEDYAVGRERDEQMEMLYDKLDPTSRGVLRCYMEPPAALLAIVRNHTGPRARLSLEIQMSHVALYLRITESKVKYALARIREMGGAMTAQMESLPHAFDS